MKSKLGWSIFRPAICIGHKRSTQVSAVLRGASTHLGWKGQDDRRVGSALVRD
jgi:hypothetical protein